MSHRKSNVCMGFYQGQDLEWIVLSVEDGKALLICQNVIDSLPYHDRAVSISWKDSWIRHWLNYRFFQEAFSLKERLKICDTHNCGELDVEDHIFFLSEEEILRYMNDGLAKGEASIYACEQGVYVRKQKDIIKWNAMYQNVERSYAWWWTRTIGKNQMFVRFVNSYGHIHEQGKNVISTRIGVRPAMWITWTN